MKFWEEFKTFAMRGNVVDLAVAVVMGAAFNKIISSLVDGIIMPILGILCGGINISDKTLILGNAVIKWGAFLQSVIDFTLIALVIFLIIKTINYLHHQPITTQTKLSASEKILIEIRDLLKDNQTSTISDHLVHMPTVTHQ